MHRGRSVTVRPHQPRHLIKRLEHRTGYLRKLRRWDRLLRTLVLTAELPGGEQAPRLVAAGAPIRRGEGLGLEPEKESL